MPPPAYGEPLIFGRLAVNASFMLILITSLGSIVQQIAFSDCDSVLAIPVQWTSFLCALLGMVSFYMAIFDRNEKLMRLVILLTFYGVFQSILVAVISLSTFAGSKTCIEQQISLSGLGMPRSLSLRAVILFSNHVKFVHGGSLNEVIAEYAILVGAFTAVLIILYISAIFSHFTLLKSFREYKNVAAKENLQKEKLKK